MLAELRLIHDQRSNSRWCGTQDASGLTKSSCCCPDGTRSVAEPYAAGAQRMDLLGCERQTASDKRKSYRTNNYGIAGRKTSPLLLDGLHPPYGQADEPISARNAQQAFRYLINKGKFRSECAAAWVGCRVETRDWTSTPGLPVFRADCPVAAVSGGRSKHQRARSSPRAHVGA